MTDATPTLPATMPAAIYRRPHDVAVEERPVPQVGPHDALIAVSHCGVCGSDLHTVVEGWGRPGTIPGHEYSGVVVALGDRVEGWRIGAQVVGGAVPGCGTCAMCRASRPSLCEQRDTPGKGEYQGAFAEYVLVEAAQLVAVPEGLPMRVAALAEPLAVSLHAITRSAIAPGMSALVSGAGPIGALIVAALAARGIEDITVVEPADRRRDLARRAGATRVLVPGELDVPTIFEPERIVEGAVDVVYECSGKRAAIEAGLCQLRRAGRLVIVGAGIDPPQFDPNRILLNELVVTGAYTYDAHGFEDALALLASGTLPTDVLIERADVGLDGLLGAIELLATGEIPGKVMVVPRRDATKEKL